MNDHLGPVILLVLTNGFGAGLLYLLPETSGVFYLAGTCVGAAIVACYIVIKEGW